MKTEKYYAIRIGDAKHDDPYLMLAQGKLEPMLFASRACAEEFLMDNKAPGRKVVKVRISYAG